MTHPDGDVLLKYVLQTLDESDRQAVDQHLSLCRECRSLRERTQGEVERLGRIEFHIDVPAPPELPRGHWTAMAVWRWAAVLGVGFILGYVTANLSESPPSIPVQQRLIPTRNAGDSSEFISCQAVDVSATMGGTH